MASAALAFCSTIRMVTPWSRRRIRVRNTSCTRFGDRPIEGSSMRMSFGSSRRARATSSCFCWPPESSIALRFANLPQHRELVHHRSMRWRTLPDPARDAAELEIVIDGQLRHHIAALRHIGDAVGDHLARRLPGHVLAVQQDLAGVDVQQAEDRLEHGGFAGAVRPDTVVIDAFGIVKRRRSGS